MVTSNKWKLETLAQNIVSRGWHITQEDGSTVAIVLGENLEAETGRDAKLISAAPDMISALEIIKTNLEAMRPMIELKTEFDRVTFKATLEACDEAIKKAKGL